MNSTQSTTLRDALHEIIRVCDGTTKAWHIAVAALAAADATDQGQDEAPKKGAAECLSVMLWLYRRLPRVYERPPHIELPIKQLAAKLGVDVESDLAERGAARPAPIGAVAPEAMRALIEAHDLAMKQTVQARIPECGDFGAIAQNLAFVLDQMRGAAAPAAPIAEVTDADKFCDGHCCWSGHHKDCVRADPEQASPPSLLDTIERKAPAPKGHIMAPPDEDEPVEQEMCVFGGACGAGGYCITCPLAGQQSVAVDGAPSTGPAGKLTKGGASAIRRLALDLETSGRITSLSEGQEKAEAMAKNRELQCALEDVLASLTAPSTGSAAERDAARWRAFRARDELNELEAGDFLHLFREDADELIDAAMQQGTAPTEGKAP